MTFKEIQELLKFINKSNLTEFKLKDGEFELSVRTDKYEKGKAKAVPGVPAQPVVAIPPVPAQSFAPPAAVPVAVPPAPAAQPDLPKEEPAAASTPEADNANYLEIKSPIVGTFYRSSSPEKPPYIKVGDTVAEGDVVCIVEAMKLFNEIESEISGKVVKVVVEDAQPVEYDQVLFLVDPKG